MSPSDLPVRLVEVLVRNARGEMLVVRADGEWSLPVGRIDPGESVGDAGVRVVSTATGVRAAIGHVIGMTDRDSIRHEHTITFAAVAIRDEIEDRAHDMEARWETPQVAARLVTDHPVGIGRMTTIEGVPYLDLTSDSGPSPRG